MEFFRGLISVFLAITGWACVIFAGVIYGIKCAAVVVLGMVVTALIGRVI